jgi:polysaccharide export outer membrane protein
MGPCRTKVLARWREIVMVTLGAVCTAASQGTGGLSLPELSILRSTDVKRTDVPAAPASGVPMDGPLVAEEYYVGAGDLLALNVWSSAPLEHRLSVTPEGMLLIPNVGAVQVGDRPLAEVKHEVSEAVKRKYPNSDVTISLISSRKLLVQIQGVVLKEGPFEMNAVQRVGSLIAAANVIPPTVRTTEEAERQLAFINARSSRRNILLRRRDGSTQRVDLVRYAITKEGRYNPYLRDGDYVYVPQTDDLRNSLGVFGGVNKYGRFEFVHGDSITDLIEFGYGFNPRADSQFIKLYRLSIDASKMEEVLVDYDAIRARRSPNIALQPGDRVVVVERTEQRQNYFVAVAGEVAYPGFYPITRNSTKLSEVIRSAGGFTPEANIPGITVLRSDVESHDETRNIEQEMLLSTRSAVASQDSGYFLAETALRLKGEYVSVDSRRLFVLGDTTADVTMRNYDRIHIPHRKRTVYVFGQVVSPGHVPFVEGRGYRYYVEKAGGFSEDARSGDVKVIKSNTRVWLDPGEATIEDGDYVWVPKEHEYPFSYYITTYSQVAAIIGVMATVALLINTIK